VSTKQVVRLQEEADYYRDRVALLRARLYRWGLSPTARLKELERQLELVEQRLRDALPRPKR
jgi:hypothetical protein